MICSFVCHYCRCVDPGYEGIKFGVRGYQIRGTRVSNSGYENSIEYQNQIRGYKAIIRSGVRGY